MSVRLLSIVPGKPMYTSTKEFRPQSQKSCYQKTFWGWHTQYTPSRSPFSGPKDPQIACYLAVTPLSDAMVFYAMGIFRFIFNICRNHIVFSVPFNLAEVTSVSQFSFIMETKIQFDWITFTQLINIWNKKNLQGNWSICIIQVPKVHKEQIKNLIRSLCQDICMKFIVPAFVQSSVDMGLSLLLHTSPKETMMLLSWSGLSTLITLRCQIRTSSWTFSPASIFPTC